ncbi:IclR family transcriptional regulator [Bradyrhizobium prioriisuperbiae]|uniref:IclR family transcriptional regulator n=1 Tax=Bradyrhizobium prioriisuperbiae TaxID=2854389 RepID=UPI0028E24198|nr:IclR family transcriptional regulator [Bradyrhizobium prioritasuperba]
MKLDPTSSVKSADRAFDILEYVADAAEPPSFSQMLVDLRIPRSSLFHLLNNLLGRGYLEQDSVTDRYRVGDHVRQLAKKISGPPLATLVAPFLKQLTNELNETAGFYVGDGNTVETIASTTSSQALAYTMKVGERAPLYAVSSGKITLSRMSPGEFDAYLKDLKFEAVTPQTITSKRGLREDLAIVRQTGFAHSREEFTPGITGMATAVEHNGRFFGALNLAVPTVRFNDEREAVFRRQLAIVAAALGQMLASRT